VPTDASLVRDLHGQQQLTAMANAYPADFLFTNSTLATRATVGSSVSFWDVGGLKWVGGAKGTRVGQPIVATQRVTATSGFFMKEAGSVTTWTNTKPLHLALNVSPAKRGRRAASLFLCRKWRRSLNPVSHFSPQRAQRDTEKIHGHPWRLRHRIRVHLCPSVVVSWLFLRALAP
jgi:hypothetical protein